MSSPEKKRKTSTENRSLVETSILSLPDDLLLTCFARVSRFYYPTLSLVCKSFRSFLYSPKLYEYRSLLGRTENCLYVCVSNMYNEKPYWFTLCLKPNQTLTNGTKKYALSRVPSPPSPSPEAHGASFVSVGCNIYAIGGSSNVSILDCRSHTWYEAPSMRVKRLYPSPCVFDGKIYVAGGSDDSLMEVFDPKTQTWEHVLNPLIDSNIYTSKSVVIDGEICMVGKCNESMVAVYKPKEDKWQMVEMKKLNYGFSSFCYCVIDNVLYCCEKMNRFKWYDFMMGCWRYLSLMGLEKLKFNDIYNQTRPKLVDYGGKMVVFWVSFSGYYDIVMCCAVIALERRNNVNEEICGNIEWCEDILKVSTKYTFVQALAANV